MWNLGLSTATGPKPRLSRVLGGWGAPCGITSHFLSPTVEMEWACHQSSISGPCSHFMACSRTGEYDPEDFSFYIWRNGKLYQHRVLEGHRTLFWGVLLLCPCSARLLLCGQQHGCSPQAVLSLCSPCQWLPVASGQEPPTGSTSASHSAHSPSNLGCSHTLSHQAWICPGNLPFSFAPFPALKSGAIHCTFHACLLKFSFTLSSQFSMISIVKCS